VSNHDSYSDLGKIRSSFCVAICAVSTIVPIARIATDSRTAAVRALVPLLGVGTGTGMAPASASPRSWPFFAFGGVLASRDVREGEPIRALLIEPWDQAPRSGHRRDVAHDRAQRL